LRAGDCAASKRLCASLSGFRIRVLRRVERTAREYAAPPARAREGPYVLIGPGVQAYPVALAMASVSLSVIPSLRYSEP
jgi:hypothetical protein